VELIELTFIILAGDRMVGDVNLFIGEDAECEIMIASKEDRRKGYGREALRLL
jgi:RimJ/RimL family protein N-acetyltransferase